MSIKEVGNKSKPEEALPNEEEFDIVPAGGNIQNKANLSHHTFTAVALMFVASISFAIGKLVPGQEKSQVILRGDEEVIAPKVSGEVLGAKSITEVSEVQGGVGTQKDKSTPSILKSGPIVASKNGTKYYSLTCSGVKRIKEENKIFFASREDAERAGLSPSSTCKDLK